MLRLICLLFIILASSCQQEPKLFNKISSEVSNITFQNSISNSSQLNILNYLYFYNGAGVAAGDFNNDGLVDLYFVANQEQDKLYLNKGNLEFQDISQVVNLSNDNNWTTGVTTVDINNDGLLDLYICLVGAYSESKNILYVNKGVIDGIPRFENESDKYGLDISSYSTQAVFFDFDLDGDLDMFLLNHSVHPNRTYGKGSTRETYSKESGDILFENIDGSFVDVSQEKGIFQGKTGYGLGLSVSDVNNDGYPDIYVGNDFFENDYLYLNQNGQKFKEVISTNNMALGHTSHYSMGNAIADINNDSKTDILSLDMLPDDLETYKTSGLEFSYPVYEQYLKNGYSPQYMQNTLHINNGNETFSESAYLSGIAGTEWSWSPLIADFNNNGFKDLYITNGILGATNNMDFINFISNEKIQNKIEKGLEEDDFQLFKDIPERKASNYFFINNRDNTFTDVTNNWSSTEASLSNGAVYADLDNDGDLDIVVNNINEPAFVLENTSNKSTSLNYIKVGFNGSQLNRFAIGAKLIAYRNAEPLFYENYTTKGYLSAVEPKLNIGLGLSTQIDSLVVIWPNGLYEKQYNLAANQEITLNYSEAIQENYYSVFPPPLKSYLNNIRSPVDFKHKDRYTLDFNKNPLIPYASSNWGPKNAVIDFDNDGLEDIFLNGGKAQASELLIQNEDGTFNNMQSDLFEQTAINEDTSSLFFDANSDNNLDLLVVSGGNEFKKGTPISPRLYLNTNGTLTRSESAFKEIETNASSVKSVDFDNDGDLDISITSNSDPSAFGETPEQFLLLNDGKGNFENITSVYAKEFQYIGNVTDVAWVDLDANGYKDLIAVGHWMPISIFLNTGTALVLQKPATLKNTNGWWNTIEVDDFDKDGDFDIVVGNWGLNTRLQAAVDEPINLYTNDFDDNGKEESIVTHFYKGVETTFSTKEELTKQIPIINKKYLSFEAFAKADLNQIFSLKKLEDADKKQCFELATCYLENMGDFNFKKTKLPFSSQISSVNAIQVDDFNNDGYLDLLLAGNNYEISTQLGRLDASHGSLLLNDKLGFFKMAKNQNFDIAGPARSINKITINNKTHYLIGINNQTPIFLIQNE
ncbi:MAG: hypothetical protein ACI9AT_001223 [Ulvibacter sp.]|jgi:hypothetical protein